MVHPVRTPAGDAADRREGRHPRITPFVQPDGLADGLQEFLKPLLP